MEDILQNIRRDVNKISDTMVIVKTSVAAATQKTRSAEVLACNIFLGLFAALLGVSNDDQFYCSHFPSDATPQVPLNYKKSDRNSSKTA
jgi:hypothetical protein